MGRLTPEEFPRQRHARRSPLSIHEAARDPRARAAARSARNAAVPVPRAPSLMRDGKDLNPVGQLDVGDVKRKAPNRHTTDVAVRDSRDQRSRSGGELDATERALDHVQEVAPEAVALRFVPRGCGPEFGLRISADPQRTLQRLRRSRSMRPRSSDQGSPGSSPERARTARSAISAAHAASTPSSAPASRLAISSAASSARPAGSSFNACSRSLVAALVTSERYRGRSGPTSPGHVAQPGNVRLACRSALVVHHSLRDGGTDERTLDRVRDEVRSCPVRRQRAALCARSSASSASRAASPSVINAS